MPDVQEVFRMSTHDVKPDPGALERQHTHQRRRSVGKKVGAFAVAAAIGLLAVGLILTQTGGTAPTPVGDPTPPPISLQSPPPPSADAVAEKVARGFLGAYGAFAPKRAMSYVADDADLSGLIETQVSADQQGLSLQLAFFEAEGYEQTITSCTTSPFGDDTAVTCGFDFHAIRSGEIGRGPFSGSDFTLIVRDGEITRATMHWDVEGFSPQVWEPFAEWVSTAHPKDAEVMYVDDTLSNFRLTEESIRLWEQRSREYVKAVRSGDAE